MNGQIGKSAGAGAKSADTRRPPSDGLAAMPPMDGEAGIAPPPLIGQSIQTPL